MQLEKTKSEMECRCMGCEVLFFTWDAQGNFVHRCAHRKAVYRIASRDDRVEVECNRCGAVNVFIRRSFLKE
jgi:phage FluMu protein Com